MVGTPDSIAQSMLAKLGVTDPGLSLEIGTPERKILDTVAEAISECTIDNYLIGNSLDISTKSGTDLENFVNIFGFSRQAGRYATGTVDFVLSFPATNAITIPVSSQVYVPAPVYGLANIMYNTVSIGTIASGGQVVSIPVQCAVTGTIGNVATTSISGFIGGYGVASVTNSAPMSGGVDPESDDALRQRFRRTFLRNIAGTQAFYVALMLQNIYTSQVLVVGPYQYFKEEIQFNGSAKQFSTNTQIKYLWPQGWFLYHDQGLPGEKFYINGVDYVVDTTVNPPGITPIHPNLTTPGAVADFEYQYTTLSSRNDPYNNIANKVDIFINGSQATDVTDSIVASTTTFTTVTTSLYYTGNFVRVNLANVVAGHVFQPLGSVPIVSSPGAIYSPTETYIIDTDYIVVNSKTLNAGTVKELAGIEWLTTPPAAGTMLTVSYTYNRLPEIMQSIINAQKQITTDVLVHQAKYAYLYVSVVVVYSFNVDIQAVNNDIINALKLLLTNSGFGSWMQFSDFIQTVHNVIGVDNVRMATLADVGDTGPYLIAARFNSAVVTQYTKDFKIPDNTIPIYDGVNIVRKSSNSF